MDWTVELKDASELRTRDWVYFLGHAVGQVEMIRTIRHETGEVLEIRTLARVRKREYRYTHIVRKDCPVFVRMKG